MYIDESETKNMHRRRQYEEHRYI